MSESNTTGVSEYDALIQGMAELRQKIRDQGKQAVAALFQKFFVDHPEVTAIGWKQFTPYFNDGAPCTFRVKEFYYSTCKDLDFSSSYTLNDEEIFQDCYEHDDVYNLYRRVNYEIFENAFGNHVIVIATPKGFHINEYSIHD